MAFLFKKSPTAHTTPTNTHTHTSGSSSGNGNGSHGNTSVGNDRKDTSVASYRGTTSPLPPVVMSSGGSSSGSNVNNHNHGHGHVTSHGISSSVNASSSSSTVSGHSSNSNGVTSIRSSPSTVSSPATVAYGGAVAYERPLPSVTTSGHHGHTHSYSGTATNSVTGGISLVSSYNASHTPLPLPSTQSSSSSSHVPHVASGAPSVGSGGSGNNTIGSGTNVHTLPPVAGASAAPSTVSMDDGHGHGHNQGSSIGSHGIGMGSDDEKMMMESKVTDEVLRMRNHLRSLPNLSKRTFTIGATLGTGTFGRVRLCSYTPPVSATTGPGAVAARQNYYALKMLKKSEIIRLKQVEHIKAEKSILSRIAHPYIVTLYASFQDDKSLYMLMEYVIGGELFSQLRKVGRFSNDTSRFYAAEIVLALQYLHNKNIVYRDLKPENLLIDSEGHIRITDFGFAKHVEDRTWTLCGTPEYLAPEIIQSRGHSKAVDWWALGILIYEMLAGYPPFYDENPFGIYQKILAGKIEFPKHFDLHARDLVKKLLTADRTKRFGCLKDGAEDIKRHRWFKNVDWVKCYQRRLKPPYVPVSHAANDTSNFDKYPDSDEHAPPPPDLAPKDKELFDDF